MDVSIAIATWNRAKSLDRTLRQLCRLRVPEGVTWELLVVQNDCTDETPAVVESYTDRLPIVGLVEPALGISNARNCARRAARGDLLILTDDDILVDEDWLASYVSAMKRWPNAGYFGGVITPLYEQEPPPWFQANEDLLRTFVGEAHDLGSTERVLTPAEWPWGANMAFRRAAYEQTSFRSDIGRRGNDRTDRDDEVFCDTLARAGLQGVWVPSAKVLHVVGANHLTLSLVRRNYIGQAVTRVRLWGEEAKGVTMMLGVPRWLILATAKAHAKYLWRRITKNPAWFQSFVDAARTWGALSEYWRRRRAAGA